MNLDKLGWNQFFEDNFSQYKQNGNIPARIIREHKNLYEIITENGELIGEVSGKMHYDAESRADYPAVGDWVTVAPLPGESKAVIHAILPRKSNFSRRAVLSGSDRYGGGDTDQQVLASNIDTVFIVCGLDGDFNVRRAERYLTIAWDGGANPVIILNKSDICDDIAEKVAAMESIAFGIPIHPVSAETNEGIDELRQYIDEGKTVAFLGSSGVGKSSIINCLIGAEKLKTGAVRDYDNKGRHTTTHRELILLPEGGMVIDTPGMREIQIWEDEEGLEKTFSDIEELSLQCRFRDCKHQDEPGCAVQKAIEDETLEQKRYQSYLKLQRELQRLSQRKNIMEMRKSARARDKMISQHLKEIKEIKNGRSKY
ncbi:MAG: ribosome small subunit-dependent GTPase A [candidate division Zixibacteria bacterium]|nr:ribosome small subunit-dependent GTPase A [candidate division Zixibacteria bacterium]